MGREIPSLLRERASLTDLLGQSPYNAELYLERALCHEQLEYPDLAAGDAYKALLLTDEALDESGEFHEQAVRAIAEAHHIHAGADHEGAGNEQSDGEVKDSHALDRSSPATHDHDEPVNKHPRREIGKSPLKDIARNCARRTFVVLTRSLSKCGCSRSAFDFSQRGLKAFPDNPQLQQLQDEIVNECQQYQQQKDPDWKPSAFDPKKDLPEIGSARQELYSWNHREPDRMSPSSLSFLNSSLRKVAPKCEVRAVSLPLLTEQSSDNVEIPSEILQVGIFATSDIAPHEIILREPSLLAANNQLHGSLCDSCSGPLPVGLSFDNPLPSCPSCDDIIFCSQVCLDAAQTYYHPAVCGKSDFDIIAKDTSRAAASNALYLLLLARTFALSETQQVHPLELFETKYLRGDFVPSAATHLQGRHLPFTFDDNIAGPLHLLEKIDVNIFTSLTNYDTWVLNTLYAKFRATASARLSTKHGGPEVCAVHPMWCLANHSCAPNVKWEWGGEIQFVARDEAEVEKWRGMRGRERGKEIKKGEEILNHYCDVELGLKERREWAAGALGGVCVCERCLWEEEKEKK